MRGWASFDNSRNEYTGVVRVVLVANATRNAEPEAFGLRTASLKGDCKS